MNYSVEETKEPPKDWDSNLLQFETGSIYHSTNYAEYARKWLKWDPKFYRLTDSKGNVVLQNLLLEYVSNRVPKQFRGFVKKIKGNMRWNFGPVAELPEAIDFFLKQISKSKQNIIGTTSPLLKHEPQYFKKSLWGTFLIDLSKTKDEIYANLDKKNCRKNIERSIERGITIAEITDSSFKHYYRILNQYRKTIERLEVSFEESFDFWKLLKSSGFSGFIAKKDGNVIGGITFSFFNKYLNEWGVARTKQDTEKKLYAQDFLKWKIIEWGLDNNMKWFDLSGFNPNPESEKERGILRYKKKWGGEQYCYWKLKK